MVDLYRVVINRSIGRVVIKTAAISIIIGMRIRVGTFGINTNLQLLLIVIVRIQWVSIALYLMRVEEEMWS